MRLTNPSLTRTLQPVGVPLTPVEGVPYTGVVATFMDTVGVSASPPPTASDYNAYIDWGDGTFVSATVASAGAPGIFTISGTSPSPLSNPDALISAMVEYATGGTPTTSRPASLSEPIQVIPTAPSGLSATAASDSEIDLAWTNNSAVATGVEIDRSADGVTYSELAAVPATPASYADTGLSAGALYYYRIEAINGPQFSTGVFASASTEAVPFPTAPSGVSFPSVAGSSVQLSWTASTEAGATLTYEVLRDGVAIGSSTSTSFTDSGLTPDTAYAYSVVAFDGSDNQSAPATGSITTSSDTTPPSAPLNVAVIVSTASAVTLSWSPAADNVGVAGYEVYRNVAGDYTDPPTLVATTADLTATDTSASAGQTYNYTVFAFDAAGNVSPASGAVAVSVAAPPDVADVTQDQYVPAAWQNYFYATLTPAIREVAWESDSRPPAAQGWLDFSGVANPDTILADGTQVSSLPVADNVFTAGGAVWIDNTDGKYNSGDVMVSGSAPAVGTEGTLGDYLFVSATATGYTACTDPGSVILAPSYGIQGVQGQLCYRDIYNGGTYEYGDPIWYDATGNSEYETGDPVLSNPSSIVLEPGMWGNKNGLNFYDFNGTGTWAPNDTLIWSDNSTFAQDFAAAYASIDACQAWANDHVPDAPSMGSVLNSLGVPSYSPPDTTISFYENAAGTGSYYVINGSSFTFQPGDNIEIDGTWSPAPSNNGIVTGGGTLEATYPLVVDNWTLVPDTTVNGVDFSYSHGQPDASSLLFPQQFQQLHDFLSLTTPDLAEPPDVGLPVISQMELENVVQDTNLDDIVQVDHDQTTFGPDTGSISFEAQRDMPQVYIPLNTDGTDAGYSVPLHAYISQGGFGTSTTDVGDLTTDLGAFSAGYGDPGTPFLSPDQSDAGQPFAYSLDTHLVINMLVTEGDNDIKRIEVVRPKGNTVVFNFPWNSATNEFSPIGTPIGIDANRTYVLRALDPSDNSSLSYQLQFSSGVVQTFTAMATPSLPAVGILESVSDASGLADSLAVSYDGMVFPEAFADSQRYTTCINWQNGQIASVDYSTISSETGAASQTIQTSLSFGGASGNDVVGLSKVDLTTGADIPEFSYAVGSDGENITNDGIEVARTGSFEDGSVTLTETAPGSSNYVGSLADTTGFNSQGMVISDTVTLDDGDGTASSASTGYVYGLTTADTNSGTDRFDNGAPIWGKVTEIDNPDDSWESFDYDPGTGWLTQDNTPFKNSDSSDPSAGQSTNYGYSTTNSGGVAADPTMLYQPPRQTLNEIEGIIVSSALTQFTAVLPEYEGTYFEGYEFNTLNFATRYGVGNSVPTWASAQLQSTTTIEYDNYTAVTPTGTTVIPNFADPDAANSSFSFGNNLLSQSNSSFTPFGGLVSSVTTGIGEDPTSAAAVVPTGSSADPFGRTTGTSVNSGELSSTLSNYGWLGPATSVDASGVETDYTYTPFGTVATSTSNGVQTTFDYDMAGNVIHVHTVGTYLGQAPITTDTYATFDAQGHETSDTDAMDRVTTTAYADSSTGTTETVTYNDGSTMVEQFYLDGSPESVGGTAVTPSAYDEGVSSNGDTWAETSTNEGQNWTKTFTNTLGEQYMTEQSAPGGGSAMETSTTAFDANGRPDKVTGFDGTVTFTGYNPATGDVADTWEDVAGTGVFVPGVDPKTISADTAKTSSDSVYSGETDTVISEAGNIADFTGEKNAGLDSEEVSDGQTTQTHTELNTPAAGDTTVITTNPDGTQTKDVYTNGLLTEEDTLGTDGSEITETDYGYDALGRDDSITDWTGTTTFTLRADGSVSQVQLPDGTTQTVDDTDAKDDTPTTVTQPNGADQSQTLNPRGQELTQSGAGELPAEFGYDDNTGAMITMDLFQSGTLNSGTPETTTWAYDPATGLMTSKTFADGTSDSYAYNAKSQLTGTTEPGVFINYNYNTADQQTTSTATDTASGQAVTDSVGSYDDQGRPTSVTQTQTEADVTQYTATNALTYTPQGDLGSETQAGDVTTEYSYYPTTGFGSTGAPDALESVKLVRIGTPNIVLSETDYGYDPITKRLATVTINGQTFTYSYKAGTNLISGISAAAVTTDYSYGATTGLLTGITASSDDTSLYSAGYTYNAEQQRLTDTVTQDNGDATTTDTNWTYGYDAQNELTTVTDTGSGATLYGYSYDGAGNQTGSSFVSQYGSASTMNQLANIIYNARGDETNDGTLIDTWDAKDELTSETPVSPTSGSTKLEFQYDAQERRTEEDVYTYSAGEWSDDPTKVLKFAYQGSNLVGEFDGNNNPLVSLSWAGGSLLSVTDFTASTPTTYQVLQDANGNTVALLNPSTGAVAASFHYDPYGNIVASSGPAVNVCPILWGGMVYDGAGFAYYDAARYYSPTQGRFISRDPSGESGGLNLAEYGNNDPVNNEDTDGLSAVPIQWSTNVDYSVGGGAAQTNLKYIATMRDQAQAKADYMYNVGATNDFNYYAAQKDLWNSRLAEVVGDGWSGGKQALETWNTSIDSANSIADHPVADAEKMTALMDSTPDLLAAKLQKNLTIDEQAQGINWSNAYMGGSIILASLGPEKAAAGFYNYNTDTGQLIDPKGGWNWDRTYTTAEGTAQTASLFSSVAAGGAAPFSEATPLAATTDLGGAADSFAAESGAATRAGLGDSYASSVWEGGTGQAFSGHGEWQLSSGAGFTTVPEGTSLTVWTQPGVELPSQLGRQIELGEYDSLFIDPENQDLLSGAQTYLPGAQVPNYTLLPPKGLTIYSNSMTVGWDTNLIELLKPNMGNVQWSACTVVR